MPIFEKLKSQTNEKIITQSAKNEEAKVLNPRKSYKYLLRKEHENARNSCVKQKSHAYSCKVHRFHWIPRYCIGFCLCQKNMHISSLSNDGRNKLNIFTRTMKEGNYTVAS